jgi:ABC-type glycerol-3-phosphate transport system permease component
MPIIPRVGRKALRIRILMTVIYAVLALGAMTMVYPFLLMLATSITSSTDTNEFRVIPRYLVDDEPLFAKYIDDKYAGEIELVNGLFHTDFRKLAAAAPPAELDRKVKLVEEWRTFARTLPEDFKSTVFRGYGFHPKLLARRYRDHVREKFGGDIQALNRAYTEENVTFDTVIPPFERSNKRNWIPDPSPKMQDFLAWKRTLPEEFKPVFSVESLFAQYLREDVQEYGGDLAKASKVWGARRDFDDIPVAPSAPDDPKRRADWEGFVRNKLPYRYIRVSPAALPAYRNLLRRRYGTVGRLNEAYRSAFRSFDVVGFPERIPSGGPVSLDWSEFIAKVVPIDKLEADSPENRFRAHLASKLGRAEEGPHPARVIESVNHGLGTSYAGLLDIQPPFYESDALYVRENAAALKRSYLGRNYSIVLEYILLHGRSLVVTAVFCALVILTTLIVNPLCAYALSRFQLRYAYRILLFVLATMAFPAEVAMIPNFLLLKELGLLNTYWALILPGVASGFSIFLLKGFFDSLPKELYEAGTIDGASESRMFFNITIPLSKPIFAVIALNAFTAAYGAFMFALLVCQDPRMWTLMVWLYELQINNPQYIMMAGLAIAALPTLLVFIFAQNVIMRGIILPSEK